MNKRKLISLVSAVALLLTVLCSSFVGVLTASADDTQKVLEPGVYDDLMTTEYYTTGVLCNAVTNPPFNNLLSTAWGADWPALNGALMGQVAANKIGSDNGWDGSYLQYKVLENTFVAVSYAGQADFAEHLDCLLFQVSADGTNWEYIDATSKKATPKIAGQFFTSALAVVKIPAGKTYLRAFIPGYVKGLDPDAGDGVWWGARHDCCASFTGITGVACSAYDFSQYTNLNHVPEFIPPMLVAGVYDDLTTDEYYKQVILGTDGSPNWLPEANWEGRVAAFGYYMGRPIAKRIGSGRAWGGYTLEYDVDGNTYVGIGYVVDTEKCQSVADHFDHFGYYTSTDGSTWTEVKPEQIKVVDNRSDATDVYTTLINVEAVIKLDADVEYFRATLPGYSKTLTKENDEGTWWASRDAGCEFGVSFGAFFASSYDLTKYTLLEDVPDAPGYVNKLEKLNTAISVASALNEKLYAKDEAWDAFIAKLAEAKAYAEEFHSLEENNAMADALNAAREALNERGAPSDATIAQDADKLILKPGMADWLEGSVLIKADGTDRIGTDSINKWYACYTDYAAIGMTSHLEDWYINDPDGAIHATNYDFYSADIFAQLTFMGRPVNNAFINIKAWGGNYVQYKVYADSYAATAIVVNNKATSIENGKWTVDRVLDEYVFLVSADGENWTEVEATITAQGDPVKDHQLYKAVAKIPAGNYYYRVVMPGIKDGVLTPDAPWYADDTGYNCTFVGPTVASMNDLNACNDYAQLADATAWYVDAAIASTDTEKLQITDGYFKAMESGMTVADALALLDTTNGSVQFYDADGKAITDATTVLAIGMKADILDAKGLSMNAGRGLAMLEVSTGNDLLSIGSIEDIVLDYGVDKTVEGLTLPTTVQIEAGSGTFDANIQWNLDGCEFDPAITQTQEFTVSGTVVLPEGVKNGGNLDLTVTANVVVNGTTDCGVSSKDDAVAKVDNENLYVYIKEGTTVAEMMEVLVPVGDVEIVYSDEDGNVIEDSSVALTEGMTVEVYNEVVMLGIYEVKFMTAEDEPSEPSDPADPSDPEEPVEPSNPDTGVPFAVLPAVLAVLGGAAVVTTKKRG